VAGDYVLSFRPWSEYLVLNGGFAGIPTLQSDYNVPYLYILALINYLPLSLLVKIKAVSFFFDFTTAIFIMLIIRHILKLDKHNLLPYLAYGVALFVPPVLLNSAVWGQCDIIYTCFITIAIYLFLNKKITWAFVSYGIALAFKLQALFVLPVLFLLYFKEKKFSALNFLLIPLVNFFIYIPAWILGKPLSEITSAYTTQVGEYLALVMNYSNFYSLLPNEYSYFSRTGIIILFGFLLVFYIILFSDKVTLTNREYIVVAMITVMLCTYFLPAMHERYMFTVDLLAVIFLFICPHRSYVPVLIWLINANAYLPALYGFGPIVNYKAMALVYLGLLCLMVYQLFREKLVVDRN
jgi:Gpi18-like mannosyltransferase